MKVIKYPQVNDIGVIDFNITSTTDEVLELVSQMLTTMVEKHGVGLAAPQVGLAMPLIVTKLKSTNQNFFWKPQILNSEGQVMTWEGCLSLPNVTLPVVRANKIEIKYYDVENNEFVEKTNLYRGLDAVIIQHEIDHLHAKTLFETTAKNGLLNKVKNKYMKNIKKQ